MLRPMYYFGHFSKNFKSSKHLFEMFDKKNQTQSHRAERRHFQTFRETKQQSWHLFERSERVANREDFLVKPNPIQCIQTTFLNVFLHTAIYLDTSNSPWICSH